MKHHKKRIKWLALASVILLIAGGTYAVAKSLSVTASTTFPIDI